MALFNRRGGKGPNTTRDPAVEAGSGSNAAGRDIVNSVAQHIDSAVVLPPEAYRPPTAVPAPPMLHNIPRTAGFVGREQALVRLDAAFSTPGDVVVHAVHGLGGIGKSALAARWAAQRFTGNPRWWITADSRPAVDAGLAELGRALQPALTGLPEDFLIERAVQWLATHEDWLIVLDNVDQLDDVRFLLDRVTTGRFLITTRRATGWRTHATTLRLDVLSEGEAVDLFTRILHTTQVSAASDVATLCAELGYLPLAVEQAASYCAETGTGPRTYLRMLDQFPTQMFADTAEGGDAERTIARIWRITLNRLNATPLAGHILRILAWYAPKGIPRTLLDDLAPAPALAKAIGRLIAYSMIADSGDGTLSVHRLVQALARTPDEDDPHRHPADIDQAHDQATDHLSSAFPVGIEDPEVWPQCRTLLPHAQALADHAPVERDTLTATSLFSGTGLFLLTHEGTARATEHLRRAVAGRVRMLGDDHPDTLASRSNLAGAYGAAGDLGRAIPLHEQTLADRMRVLGDDHPDTLASRTRLANAYKEAGDLGRAIPLHEQAVADRVRVLGEDHPDTLVSRNSLGAAYGAAGDLGRAIPLFERTLADQVRVLGDGHPRTLVTRNNLAMVYEWAGDLGRAIPLFERTVADRVRVLGEDHPDTLVSRNNLAAAYGAAGDLGRAIPLLERTLAEFMRVLGDGSLYTLASQDVLATAYRGAGELGQAIPLFERTFAGRVRVLGEDHPDTLASRGKLAAAYGAAGDLGRAIPLLERTLDDCVRVLGADHPTTRQVRADLITARSR
ncbi:tetratricopeptide repeat protein [Streptomyces mirabilis]|uniref:tetratricopeptide repeat protein n=1 Tax=Streptomyces mirabilis TaxID=68239 RepID=UPI0036846EE5